MKMYDDERCSCCQSATDMLYREGFHDHDEWDIMSCYITVIIYGALVDVAGCRVPGLIVDEPIRGSP